MVGGNAIPAARNAALATSHGSECTKKRLPSCSTSVRVSESKSASIAGHVALSPSAPMRQSKSLVRTRVCRHSLEGEEGGGEMNGGGEAGISLVVAGGDAPELFDTLE